jgi:hypothetical protein
MTIKIFIGSPKNMRLNIVAKTGIEANIKTTFATLVFVTAKTNAGAVLAIKTA